MSVTKKYRCPHCGASRLVLASGKRGGYSAYSAICSVCKKEVDSLKTLACVREEDIITITKQEYYDLRAKAEVIDSIAQSQGNENIFEELLSDYGIALETYNNICKEIYKEIFGE